jgi:hypothetical protein
MSKARDLASQAPTPSTVSATELGYLDGVTSAVQTQIDSKLATTTAASTYEPTLPSQTGNSGKYLTTDGTTKSWGTVATGVTHNIVAFTSSQTWTVPASAKYVDVLVVGGGCGGRGGRRAINNSSDAGYGGGVTLVSNIYLNGTGTVSVVVGAGSSGTSGTATTTEAAASGTGGYSGFGTYAYSSGGNNTGGFPGIAGYKGTSSQYNLNQDGTQSNYAPLLNYNYNTNNMYSSGGVTNNLIVGNGLNAIGFRGGYTGSSYLSNSTINTAGGSPGMDAPGNNSVSVTTNTIPSFDFYNLKTLVGAATAGTLGGSGGTAGAAGQAGVAGGGGTAFYGTGVHGQGGPGAGGGGGHGGAQLGGSGNGGNGGNAGANTGAGGGAGGCTGSTTAGTGGNGGNGAAGIVVVHWVS